MPEPPLPANNVVPFTQPAPQQTAQAAPAVESSQPVDPATRRYKLAGKDLNLSEYQAVIDEKIINKLTRAQPGRDGAGPLSGVRVPNCFSNYVGDGECSRCPVRRNCLGVNS
jgi:hypothetical protein